MKVCPICQSTYDATVDFCFKDGAPLELQASEDSPEAAPATDFAALTMEELEPPDAVSLSGLVPIATPEDDLRTLSMGAEPPPQLDEDELATVTSGVQPLAKAEEADSQGDEVADPFAGQEEDDSGDVASGVPPVWQLGPDGDSAATADIVDRMETVQWKGSPTGVPEADSGGGFLKGIGAVVGLLVLLVGYQVFMGGAPDQVEPQPVPVELVEESAPPEVSEPVTESPVDEPQAEEGEAPAVEGASAEGDAVAEGSEPEAEDGQQEQPEPEEDQPETQEDTSGESAREQAEESAREQAEEERARRDRERIDRRKKRDDEREKRRARAAQDRADRTSAEAKAAERTAAREKAAEKKAAEKKAAEKKAAEQAAAANSEAAAGNPWTSGAAPAAPVAATGGGAGDAGNPWGVSTPAAAAVRATVTIRTKPSGAKVKIAGKGRGQSPVKADLPQGTHEIEVSKEGYLPRSSYVKVKDAEPMSMSIALEPVASAAAKREGTLFISSSPSGALLYVDGSSKGRTPISVAVTEGAHSLKLVSDGRKPVEKRIKVDFGRSTTVRRFIEIP